MSTTKEDNRERRRQYLARVFSLNPLTQPAEVLQARRKALRLARADGDGACREDRSMELDVARERIRAVQDAFWTMPLDDLKNKLRSVWEMDIPELSPVVKRLIDVTKQRSVFPQLLQEQNMDAALFRAFKTCVVIPPADAGYVKERFLISLNDKSRVRAVRRAVDIIREKYPDLYSLERDWFETLSKMKQPSRAAMTASVYEAAESGEPQPVGVRKKKSRKKKSGPSISVEFPEISWPMWLLIVFAIRVVLQVIKYQNR